MVEEQVAFLVKIASSITNSASNRSLSLLQSYYLLQCKEITRGFGLPEKHFSPTVRCSHCCLEWRNGTIRKIKQIKLSKKQKRRIRNLKDDSETLKKKEYVESRKKLLFSNEVEQICSFCGQKTSMSALKPTKDMKAEEICDKETVNKLISTQGLASAKKRKKEDINMDKNTVAAQNSKLTDVYSETKNVFSLQNKTNTIPSAIKVPKKVITNNKKRKDKYAGLCQKAVLASAKLKEDKLKQNKINLFLKPST